MRGAPAAIEVEYRHRIQTFWRPVDVYAQTEIVLPLFLSQVRRLERQHRMFGKHVTRGINDQWFRTSEVTRGDWRDILSSHIAQDKSS